MEEKDTNNQINRTENTNIDAQTNVNLNLFSYLDKELMKTPLLFILLKMR